LAAPEIAEGFPGQRIVVLPRSVIAQAEPHPIVGAMIPTDVGYFPKASGHARERGDGIDQAVIIYCVMGSGWCRTPGQELKVSPGELLIVPPGLAHKYGADERRPWTIHWVHAKGRLLSPFLQELDAAERATVVFIGKDPLSVTLFEEVLEVAERGYAFAQLLQAGQALSHLLAVLVRRARETHREADDTEQRIGQSIEYLKNNLQRRLDVRALSKVAGLSPSHYSALFKNRTGYAPIDYLARLRMHRACQLLDTTNHSIKGIAALVGYKDQLYFSRVFRAIHDVSPSDYRSQRKG
jgi:AraC-like DNA-binding protein